MAEFERKRTDHNPEESRIDQLDVLTQSRCRLISSLKVYDIEEIEMYLCGNNFLSCSKTKKIRTLAEKHVKIDFIDSLLSCNPKRCLPFSKVISDFIGKTFADSSFACESVTGCFVAKPAKQTKVTRAMDFECDDKETTGGMETDLDTSSTDSTVMPTSTTVRSRHFETARSAEGSDKSFNTDLLDMSKLMLVGQSQEGFGVETSLFSGNSGQEIPIGIGQTPSDSDYQTMTPIPGPTSAITSSTNSRMFASNSDYGNDPVQQGIQSLVPSKNMKKKRIRHHQRSHFHASSTQGNPRDQRLMVHGGVHIHQHYHSSGVDSKSGKVVSPFPFSTLPQKSRFTKMSNVTSRNCEF